MGSTLDIENSRGISAANILFPILNLLSADDIGILHREFNREDVSEGTNPLTFDEVRLSALQANGSDWADNISIRWRVANVQPAAHGGIYGH